MNRNGVVAWKRATSWARSQSWNSAERRSMVVGYPGSATDQPGGWVTETLWAVRMAGSMSERSSPSRVSTR